MKKRILICILSSMILGSCFAIPAFAAEPATPPEQGMMEDLQETSPLSTIEEAHIISRTTRQLVPTEPNMIQHEEVTTVYEDGLEMVTTLKTYSDDAIPFASWKTVKGTATAQAKSGGKPVALITVNGEFRYDSTNKLVERTNYTKNIQIQDSKYKVDRFDYQLDTGTQLNGKTWASVRANFKVSAYLTNYAGYAELKCNSDGVITPKDYYYQET